MRLSLATCCYLLLALAAPLCAAPPLQPPLSSPQPAEVKQVRELQVLAVAGLEYRLYYQDWKDRMRSVVTGASRHMEANLGLRFSVADARAWEYAGARSPKGPDETIEQLMTMDPGKCDLVIAFTLVAFPGPEVGSEIRGFTQHFSRYVVVPDQWVVAGAQTRLVHELCHVFGAFHEANPNSVMRPAYHSTPRRFEFTPATREVISLTRNINLGQGVEGISPDAARRIRELYRAHHHPREAIDKDPITVAYEGEAKRAERAGKADRANELRELARNWSTTGQPTTRSE